MFHDLNQKTKRNIVFLATLVISVSVAALIFQFFRLQVLEHEKWAKRARLQHYFTVVEPFHRGVFYANPSFMDKRKKNIPFTVDLPLYHLYADSSALPDELKTEAADAIMRLLSPSVLEAKRLLVELKRHSHSRRLVCWLTEEQKALFLHWWSPWAKKNKLPSNALYFVSDFRRIHPMGSLLGQVLHTIRERRDDRTGKAYPTGGLELSLNSYLEGTIGLRRLMRSPRNHIETGEVIQEPVHGANVELTIDPVIQAILEEELSKAVRMRQAKGGWGVLVDPWTGHILALAQVPSFFPDRYQAYFNDSQRIEYTKVKAAIDANEPGSPMKVITCSLALKANKECAARKEALIFHPLAKVSVSLGVFPGRSKPIKDVTFSRWANMYMAIQRSSNVYCAGLAGKVVDRMGPEWYRHQLVSCFGLGTKTGIELVGESIGVIPRPNTLTANKKLEWSKATPYSLGIGYNVQMTSLQMARAFCVLATRGTLPTFTLVRQVWKEKNKGQREVLVDNTLPSRVLSFPKVLDRDIAEEVVRAMKFVTKPGGSASKADIFGYTEVGKTGTTMKLIQGKYSNQAHIASFVGFAPVATPRFVLALTIDEAKPGFILGFGFNHRGGAAASPIFREVGRRVLEYMREPYDDPYGFAPHDPRRDEKKADWMKETEALNALYKAWNG
jgi:cell division protein FtsI (penicillin-binding protein 3)